MEYKLEGYISGDTFGSKGNSHFSDKQGKVVCKSKNRFGFDCSVIIKFESYETFYTDYNKCRNVPFWKNHLPLEYFITCKKCQKVLQSIF